MKRFVTLLCTLLLLPQLALAHIGSKDVFEEATAGPYKLFITIRTPMVIPGVATVEVRSMGAAISSLSITPLPLTGEASKHPPAADAMKVSADDPAFFTGAVWMMAAGSWQIRFNIDGAGGRETASVPVPAVALSTLKMDRNLGLPLAALGLFLVLSMAGVVAAAVREASLRPGVQASSVLRRRGLIALVGSLVLMTIMVYGGAKWWNVEAANYADAIYAPLATQVTLTGNQLDFILEAHDLHNVERSNKDFLPDHGHLMHLYAIREPEMDAVFHLHPTLQGHGDFRLGLPAMPPGTYKLYGDVVHASGFPETLVSTLTVPDGMAASKPGLDDAAGSAAPLSAGELGVSFHLPDGYNMVWDKPAGLIANNAYAFRFRLLTRDGKVPADMQPYMGMKGHAAFVKIDGTVFAHVHPEGSAAMAAVMLANPSPEDTMPEMQGMEGMSHPPGYVADPNANIVEFPYGFPSAGRYRIFVQMKHGPTVETGTFDADVK
jgi:hypothetical protein